MIHDDPSPIELINQLRANSVPGKVEVSYQGKHLGDYAVTFVHMSTIQLRCIEKDRTPHPLYVPNPLHCGASYEVSADNRTFVSIRESGVEIFRLTFHNYSTLETPNEPV